MPNIRIARVDMPKARRLIKTFRDHLPDDVISDVVVTVYPHSPCLSDPTAQIAYSNGVPDAHLQMIRRAVHLFGFDLPDQWRYWPPWPAYPTIEVFIYGADEVRTQRIMDFAAAQDTAFYTVPSMVFDIHGEQTCYAEVRAYRIPDVNGIMRSGAVAVRLKELLDVEVFAVCDGQPTMQFWPQGANAPIG